MISARAVAGFLVLGGALVSPGVAQDEYHEDWEGVFTARVNGKAAMADTIRVSKEEMSWIRYRAAQGTECAANFSGLIREAEIDSGTVSWRCTSSSPVNTWVEFDPDSDVWFMRAGGRAASPPTMFRRVGERWKYVDRGPRAVQPPAAVGDSVVRDIRALYGRVNVFPCVNRSREAPLPRNFVVCAQGDTVGRISVRYRFEYTGIAIEFTYDAKGAIRFVYEMHWRARRDSGSDSTHWRKYFADGRLIRELISEGSGKASPWDASVSAWARDESETLAVAAACLALAKVPAGGAGNDFLVTDTCTRQ